MCINIMEKMDSACSNVGKDRTSTVHLFTRVACEASMTRPNNDNYEMRLIAATRAAGVSEVSQSLKYRFMSSGS